MTLVTWSTIDKASGLTLSNGNLTASTGGSGSTVNGVRATEGKSSGKWYWEIKINTHLIEGIGISTSADITTGTTYGVNARVIRQDGQKQVNATSSTYGTAFVVNDIISVLVNMDNGTIEFWQNGVSKGFAFTDLKPLTTVFAYIGGQASQMTANFGASIFTYPIPVGYYSYDRSQNGARNKILLLSNSDNEVKSLVPKVYTNTIPVMTSNTLPFGVASASSENNATYQAWKAFNGIEPTVNSDAWITVNAVLTGWLKYQFPTAKIIKRYSVTSRYDTNRGDIKTWTFEGSNTGSFTGEQVILDSRINVVGWNQAETKYFDCNNTTPYVYYRINITEITIAGAANYLSIGEMKMFELTSDLTVKTISSQSESTFINHGLDNLSILDPTMEYAKKQYIQSTNNILGNGKTFTQSLDLQRYNVNKITFQ